MNRQESHRIYLQQFAPRSAASSPPKRRTAPTDGAAATPHRHSGSHEIHPPIYPTTVPGAPYQFSSSSDPSTVASYPFSSLSSYTPATPQQQQQQSPTHNRHVATTGQGSHAHNNNGCTAAAPRHHRHSPQKNRFVGHPSTVTTSAAVRLTDRAKSRDVTALLRGKFGLPSIVSGNGNNRNNNESLSSYYSTQFDGRGRRMPTRLSRVQKDGSGRSNRDRATGAANNAAANSLEGTKDDGGDVIDALVLVGTIERPPEGTVRFEHEDFSEERRRVEAIRHFRSLRLRRRREEEEEEEEVTARWTTAPPPTRTSRRDQSASMATSSETTPRRRLPIAESAATVGASGTPLPGPEPSALPAPSASGSDLDASAASGGGATITGGAGAMGLDPTSSRGGSVWGGDAGGWTTQRGSPSGIGTEGEMRQKDGDVSSSRGKLTTLVSELSATSDNPSDPSSRPPRAESAISSPRLQPKSQGGRPCNGQDSEPIHIVRTVLPDEHPLHVRDEMMALLRQWRQKAEEEMGYYLNETEGGRGGFQQRQQCPQPSFRWYFQPCSPLGGVGSSAESPKIQSIPAYIDVEGYCTEDDSDNDTDDGKSEVTGDQLNGMEKPPGPTLPSPMRQLIEERQRIAVLRDSSDPSFLVSGYLLKQSCRDPNVWRRVYCVLSEDRMWTIGRMKLLKNSSDVASDDMRSYLRVGRHKYIKLHRSLLLERGEGSVQSTGQHSFSRYDGYHLTPLSHRLPNAFRVLTSEGKCHTFRAFNSQSFRVWVASLSEKIALKHGDGTMDLANVIAEEEILARCRRMDEIAVSPIDIHDEMGSTEASSISMDIVRFGIAVVAFRELCRHVHDAIRQYKNHHGNVVNFQTRVGTRLMKQSPSPNAGNRSKNMEHAGMVSCAWEDARMVASKSAQLLHALATLQHDKLDKDKPDMSGSKDDDEASSDTHTIMEELIVEQKRAQAILGKHWDNQQRNIDDNASVRGFSLPPIQLFDPLLGKLQTALTKH